MYSRNLLIAASLAVLTLAAPTPATDIAQREEAVAERRNAFSLTGLVRDVLKRHALIEAVPDAAYDIVIDQRSEEVDDDEDMVEDVDVDASKQLSDDLEDRGLQRHGGGGSKRGLQRGGGGGSKRGLQRGGGGGSKRGLSRPKSGGSKRGLTRPGIGGSK